MTTGDIIDYIPQRAPFVMVDSIQSHDETVTRTCFRILPGNLLVESEVLKEPGMVENIAQSAAAHAGFLAKQEGLPVRLGYIGAIKNLRIHGFPKINEEIITEIRIENQIFDVSVVSGKISCNNKLLAECEMKIFIINQ